MLLWTLLCLPVVAAVLTLFAGGARRVLALCVVASFVTAVVAVVLVVPLPSTPIFAAADHLFVDALSAYHTLLVVGVFAASSVYAWSYFGPAIERGELDASKASRFGFLWMLFLASMLLTLLANNVGLMWVGMESTTVASALLVSLDGDRASVRAAWTYLVMCSVAIALALLGILVVYADAQTVAADGAAVSLWTELRDLAPRMHTGPLRLGFLFAVVGYGTKAGLAPMHSWLPDAHGQAPTPVSAVLSGALLNCALYSLSRFLPVVEPAGAGWAHHILIAFGLVSIGVAAAFIVHERDIKRLLAFSSVEHVGVITLGLGFGAASAALFHTFSHSACKMLAFFCAGSLVARYQSRDMDRMYRTVGLGPLSGAGFLLAVLALVGLPPFSIFVSELWIAQVGMARGHVASVVVYLAAIGVIFIAVVLRAVQMTWSAREPAAPVARGFRLAWPLVAIPLALVAIAGLWMPAAAGAAIERAAALTRAEP